MTDEHKKIALDVIVKNPENDMTSIAVNEETSISLTKEEKAIEEKLSSLRPMKAPSDAGNRILKAVFAETGIKREPFENMKDKNRNNKSKIQYLYQIITVIFVIIGLRLTYTLITNWGILGDPESIIESRMTIKSKMDAIENTNINDMYYFEGNPADYSDPVVETLRQYAVAKVLFDPNKHEGLKHPSYEHLTPLENDNDAKLLKERLDRASIASLKVLEIIRKCQVRDWSLDSTKLTRRNIFSHADRFGVSYVKSMVFHYYVTRYFLSKAQLHFYRNEANQAIEELITVLRFLEYIRTRQTYTSMLDMHNDCSDLLKTILIVVEKNQGKLKYASSGKLASLKTVLTQADPMNVFKRFAYGNAAFISDTFDSFFGLHSMGGKSLYVPKELSLTADLLRNSYTRWLFRPLLIHDAKKYLHYQLTIIECLEKSNNGQTFDNKVKAIEPDHFMHWFQIMTSAPEPDYKKLIENVIADEELLQEAIKLVEGEIKKRNK